jgi:hypothetical protein
MNPDLFRTRHHSSSRVSKSQVHLKQYSRIVSVFTVYSNGLAVGSAQTSVYKDCIQKS